MKTIEINRNWNILQFFIKLPENILEGQLCSMMYTLNCQSQQLRLHFEDRHFEGHKNLFFDWKCHKKYTNDNSKNITPEIQNFSWQRDCHPEFVIFYFTLAIAKFIAANTVHSKFYLLNFSKCLLKCLHVHNYKKSMRKECWEE